MFFNIAWGKEGGGGGGGGAWEWGTEDLGAYRLFFKIL